MHHAMHCIAQAADVEARKDAEEADQRERAAEIRRDARREKVAYMKDMKDEIEVREAPQSAGFEA